VAKSVVVTGNHAEVALVAAFFLGSGELDFPDVTLVCTNGSTDGDRSSLHVISVGLDEEGVLGPGGLSVVTESPLFREFSTGGDFVFVAEAFFDKTARVLDELLLSGGLGSKATGLAFFLGLLLGLLRDFDCIRMLSDVLVLAHDFRGRSGRVSNLKHRMFRMNSFSFAPFAEVVIRAD